MRPEISKYSSFQHHHPPPPPKKKNDAQLEITSYLDTSFGYWNSLLFHGFMDSHLIFRIHFVKFINAANTLQSNKKNEGNFFAVSLSRNSYHQ